MTIKLSQPQIVVLRQLSLWGGRSVVFRNTGWWRSLVPLARKGMITITQEQRDWWCTNWVATVTDKGFDTLKELDSRADV